MEFIRWFFGGALVLFFVGSAITNAAVAYSIYVTRKPSSFILFVGGIVGVAGFLLLLIDSVNHIWWLPLILDLGAGPMLLLISLPKLLFEPPTE